MDEAIEKALTTWVFAIDAVMHEQGVTRAELARRMGVSRARITDLLNMGTNPTIQTLVRVSDALGYELRLELFDAK
jgi:transcriptional regulator with XRE-family HTH domain